MRIVQRQGPTAFINGPNPERGARSPHTPPCTVPSPFCEWGLSGEFVAVLLVLESAMVDAGFPARGMTERAQRHTFRRVKDQPYPDILLMRRALGPPIDVDGPAGL